MGPVWHCDYLAGEEESGCFTVLWFVTRVLSIVVCFLFLLVSLVGYILYILCRGLFIHPVGKLIHLCFVDSATATLWTGPFPFKGVSGCYFFIYIIIEIPLFIAYSVNPDQTPRSAASDLGLRCLLMSRLWDTKHK